MYTSLGVALYTILNESVFKSTNGIAAVFNYAERELVSYPAITIVATGHENAFMDTAANGRVCTYTVRAMVRAGSDSGSEIAIRALVDAIMDHLEAHYTLDGACDLVLPTSASLSWSTDDIPVRYADIQVRIKKRHVRV